MVPVAVAPIPRAKAARPAPLRLYDEPWKACGRKLCLTATEAQRSLENKVEMVRWVRQANDVFDYYETEAGVVPVPRNK